MQAFFTLVGGAWLAFITYLIWSISAGLRRVEANEQALIKSLTELNRVLAQDISPKLGPPTAGER
jgi:hypothetical protein